MDIIEGKLYRKRVTSHIFREVISIRSKHVTYHVIYKNGSSFGRPRKTSLSKDKFIKGVCDISEED